MAKQFLEETSLKSFVVRDLKRIHEPLIVILKVLEIDEDENITLVNLMTGFKEMTTKELILKDYKQVTGDALQDTFRFIWNTQDLTLDPDETTTH